MKNVLAVHDISCVGRCSLTVAMPVISALGSTCTGLPTALLSTHTGGFTGFTCLDLTEEMRKIIKAWQPLNLRFDSVYSGFLASESQIDIVKELVASYKHEDNIVVIDPVMADDGKLYKIFNEDFVKKMGELVQYADVLIPNMTEAMLLAGIEYKDGPYDSSFIENILNILQQKGAKSVVLTGVYFNPEKLGIAVKEAGQETHYYFEDKVEGSYHGTGDLFGSVLTAELMRGKTLISASEAAVDFVIDSIHETPKNADRKYGVDFEKVLSKKEDNTHFI